MSKENVRNVINLKKSLEEVGLILEEEPAVQNIKFLKIHVPDDVLQQYAEILKLRMPLILVSI